MMMFLRLLIFLASCIVVDVHYSLYHSNNPLTSSAIFDCLYATWIDDDFIIVEPHIYNYYLIPYCRRPGDDGDKHSSIGNFAKQISFNQLKEQKITSQQLLNWFAPINIAEQYEMDNENSKNVFYNCSLPWFGSMCQYKFADDSPFLFDDIVRATFNGRSDDSANINTGTCYRFLNNCNRGPWPLCIDWREICDGKIDCINGEDEQLCEELEMNRCADNEYRCHNGQCIPLVFAQETMRSIDCLDGSDEREPTAYSSRGMPPTLNMNCIDIPTFRCEERIPRYHRQFSCGDGQFNTRAYIPATNAFCLNNRDKEMSRMMLTSLNYIANLRCRQAFYCALYANRSFGKSSTKLHGTGRVPLFIFEGEWDTACESLIEHCFSEWLVLPEKPVMLGFFQFVYLTNRSVDEFTRNIQPDFVCFDEKKCPALLHDIVQIDLIDGLTCFQTSNLTSTDLMENFDDLVQHFSLYTSKCWRSSNQLSCINPSDFFCEKSFKCISTHRVQDGFEDCSDGEDELFPSCSMNDIDRIPCEHSETNCLSPVAIGNGFKDCMIGEDERIYYKDVVDNLTTYSKLCHGRAAQGIIDYSNPNELNCEWWPCDNPYVHCDKIWDCLNGADELNCPNATCSFNEHHCKNDDLQLSYCLPAAHIVDKYIDDCYFNFARDLYFTNGSITDDNKYYSWNETKCLYEDKICLVPNIISIPQDTVCLQQRQSRYLSLKNTIKLIDSPTELCRLEIDIFAHRKELFLETFRFGDFPPKSSSLPVQHIRTNNNDQKMISHMNILHKWFCHRGILVLYGINQTKKCLCPPSYFGDQCQWQSQRISITFELSSRHTTFISFIFQMIIMLIDEQEQILPNHEEIIYIPARDCKTKFNLYLVYPHQPKNRSSNYSIRIDLFDKITLNFWASWHLSIPFQFLPVNRISAQLFIPKQEEIQACSLFCGIHGRCVRYSNKNSSFYCRCDPGYSGTFCNVTYSRNCSSDSLSIASSICVCPLQKFGSYCYLNQSICQSNPCQNDGQCIPSDDRISSQSLTCFCKNGYFGSRCEYFGNRIILNLDETIIFNSSFIFIHFVRAFDDIDHDRRTILKKIPIVSDSITIYASQPFNILFVQLLNQSYYLIVRRETFIPTENITTQVLPKQRCSNVIDLLNSTIMNLTTMDRAKFYPLLCRENPELMCLYDENHMCVCDLDRFANCFLFNHSTNHDCQGYNHCENDGQCFQNTQKCPTMSTCICKECFYGSTCRFSTRSYIISLDPILGYHIKPNVGWNRQPTIVKVSLSITLLLFIFGVISGSLSIITFRTKKSKEVGCGYYLLASSIISILMIFMLNIKFFHLVFSQMEIITNRSLLFFNCLMIDVVLKVFLVSNEWLIACVAIERLINIMQGVNFNKNKSKYIAKRIIPSICLLIALLHIHDPIYRRLIDDNDGDEQRIWCFVEYPSSINLYNTSMTLIHFLGPFCINFISALWIIRVINHNRSYVRSETSFNKELYRHKHLLYPAGILVLLGSPRLVITFTSGCMRSPRDPWLYLIGYFIAFVPSMLIFFLFVLPSQNYTDQFRTIIQRYARQLHWRLQITGIFRNRTGPMSGETTDRVP